MSNVSAGLINQVSNGVSQTTVDEISALQTNIRNLLSQNYETFLQGSYANDTAISDINDVDIIALEKPLLGFLPSISTTNQLFYDIKAKLEANQNYYGKVTIDKKCLTLQLNTKKADIVPAVGLALGQPNQYNEPIIISQGIKNYPKTHTANGQAKNQRTNGNYKKVVRMLKNYVNNWGLKAVAPSFYIECLIYSYPDNYFSNDLPLNLQAMLNLMVGYYFNPRFVTVAGDKMVISQTEWIPENFMIFKQHILKKLPQLNTSITATSEPMANVYFRTFFNL